MTYGILFTKEGKSTRLSILSTCPRIETQVYITYYITNLGNSLFIERMFVIFFSIICLCDFDYYVKLEEYVTIQVLIIPDELQVLSMKFVDYEDRLYLNNFCKYRRSKKRDILAQLVSLGPLDVFGVCCLPIEQEMHRLIFFQLLMKAQDILQFSTIVWKRVLEKDFLRVKCR